LKKNEVAKLALRGSLATPFSQGIPIFLNENELISLGKNENPLGK
jgi:hypothetical protein